MSHDVSVFVDSDVIISSILSNIGAAYLLLHSADVKKIISNYSCSEIEIVATRMHIEEKSVSKTIRACMLITLKSSIVKIKDTYREYVTDINDAHILAGAVDSQAKFLITYNTKHYKLEQIKRDFNIIVMTPGLFIQYIRSRN